MFKYRERMLTWVGRWSVLPRIKDQSVAEHSFYVALYTDQLTRILKWGETERASALSFALRHDMPEVITGDIMGPVKRIATNKQNLLSLENRTYKELGDYYDDVAEVSWRVRAVVKAANCIDEFFYLGMEVSMGNRAVSEMFHVVRGRMRRALRKLKLEAELIDVLDREARDMHQGLGFPQEDTDLLDQEGERDG